MSGYTSVLIVGSSGGIGKHITNGFLKAKPSWKVSLLVNSDTLKEPTKKQIYDEFTLKGAQLITGEVEKPETYQDKIKGIEVVVSAISGRVVKAQIPLIHAAKHAGVKLFIPSEFGFDSSSVRITRTFAPKAEIQKEIKKVGLNYIFVTTGLFYEYFLWPIFKTDIQNKQVALYGERSTKISACSLPEFSSLLPDVVNDPSSINKTVTISGDQTTTGHFCDEFASFAGDNVKITQYKPEEMLEQINSKAAENQMTVAEEIIYILANGDSYFENALNGSKYGKKLSTLHEFLQSQKKK